MNDTKFADLHSPIGDNAPVSVIKWLAIGFVFTLLAICAGLWAGS